MNQRLHSVALVDVAGRPIVRLPNVPFDVWEPGHLLAHENVVYTVIGVCGLVWIPRLLEELHLGGHAAHPRGT